MNFSRGGSGLCCLTATVKSISPEYVCVDLVPMKLLPFALKRASQSLNVMNWCAFVDCCILMIQQEVRRSATEKRKWDLVRIEENSTILLLSIFLSWHPGWENHVFCVN